MLVAIGNTSSYGGGMLICPKADPYDGLLDVTIIHPVGRLKLLDSSLRCTQGSSFAIHVSSSCGFMR
jgi:diacylglycerol kinase family enzyme